MWRPPSAYLHRERRPLTLTRRKAVRSLTVVGVIWMFLATVGLGEGMARGIPRLPSRVINKVGDLDGFGFGLGACPIGCTLPSPPTTHEADDPPFTDKNLDTPTCLSTVTWTHDFSDQLPPGAEIVSVLFVLNVAGVEPAKNTSLLIFDDLFPIPLSLDQKPLESGLFVVPLDVIPGFPDFLRDGILDVTVVKRGRTGCDDIYFDASFLIILFKTP